MLAAKEQLKKNQKVVLISFFDRTCESTRMLASSLKKAKHRPYLLFFKDDRAATLEKLNSKNKNYQSVFNMNFVGSGSDVNPPTDKEIELLTEKIGEIKPAVIGFSARTATKELCKQLVKHLRLVFPSTRYIAGGYGPTLEPEYFLQFVDYVCLGEGDNAIVDLVELKEPAGASNVASLKNGKLIYGNLAKGCALDKLPVADWSFEDKFMIEENKVVPVHQYFDINTYYIFTTRGCPSSCTYCQACQWQTMYKKYNATIPKVRLRSPQNVIAELMQAKETFNIEYVRFMDSIFGINKKWFNEFMDLYDKHIQLRFYCFVDVRWTDSKMLQRLARSGLIKTTLGIQATTEKIRKEVMGRAVKDEQIIKFARALVENELTFKYDIIHWNPFDTNETLARGAEFLEKLPKGEQVDLFQLKVFPGSKLHEKILLEKPVPLSNEEYEYWVWVYQLIMRDKTTEKIANNAMNNIYYKNNPHQLKRLLEEAMSQIALKYRLYASRRIGKNEKISNLMLTRKKTTTANAIPYDQLLSVVGKVARKEIGKDFPITMDDVYGSYERKFD